MKFILKENKFNLQEKYILSEKYSLEEAFTIPSRTTSTLKNNLEAAEQYREDWEKLKQEIEKLLNNEKEDQNTPEQVNLKKAVEATRHTINSAPRLPVLQKTLSEFIHEFESNFSASSLSPELKNIIKKIKTRLTIKDSALTYSERETIEDELIEFWKKLMNNEIVKNKLNTEDTDKWQILEKTQKALSLWLTPGPNSINTLINTTEDKLKAMATKLNTLENNGKMQVKDQNTMEDGKLTLQTYKDTVEKLDAICRKIIRLPFEIPLISPTLDLSADIIKINETLIEKLRQFKDFEQISKELKTLELELSEDEHWEEKLKAAVESDNQINNSTIVWDDYFASWGDNENFVRGLGEGFTTELLNLGFKESENPFITFVKTSLSNQNLNAKTYPAIHNAYVKDLISKKDLAGKGILGIGNLIFNNNLFLNEPINILKMLKFQNIIEFNGNKGFAETIKNKELAEFYSNKSIADLIYAVFAKNKSPLYHSITGKASNIEAQDILHLMSLNDLKTAEKNIEMLFGEVETAEEVSSSTGNELFTLLRTKGNVVEAIKYISVVYGVNPSVINKYKEVKEAGANFNLNNSQKLSKLLSKYNITEQNATQVITSLAIAAGLTE